VSTNDVVAALQRVVQQLEVERRHLVEEVERLKSEGLGVLSTPRAGIQEDLLVENLVEIAVNITKDAYWNAADENLGASVRVRIRIEEAARSLTDFETRYPDVWFEGADWMDTCRVIADAINRGEDPDVEALLSTGEVTP
jgi:hypothetical protein